MSSGFLRRLRGPLAGSAATALVFLTASALAGSGINGIFNLGVSNTVDAQTLLSGTVDGNPQLRVENGSTAGSSFGVLGRMTSASAAANSAGVRGVNSATNGNGFGVQGIHNGSGAGVFGQTAAGIGVLGKHTGSTGTGAGVQGETSSGDLGGAGVRGIGHGNAPGVRGESSSTSAPGVAGVNDGPNFANIGAVGVSGRAPNGIGVEARGRIAVQACGVQPGKCLILNGTDDIGGDFSASGQGIGVAGTACSFDCTAIPGAPPGIGGAFNAGVGDIGVRAFAETGGTGLTSRGGAFGGTFVSVDPDSTGVKTIANNGAGAIALHAIGVTGLAGEFEGNVHVTGKITKDYAAASPSSAIPIAYAVINANGTKAAGTQNVTSTFDSANSRYLIRITGDTYSTGNHITTVTPLQGAGPVVARTTSVSGKLVVLINNLAGPPVQQGFSFITYRP